ncbi:MAG: ATP-dependent helicase [Eubacteriales bacterium]
MRNPSPSQEKAIIHGTGPMLVLAGPGSGKTFVITRRIQYLIEKHHVEPEEILVITFSKASAIEMKERFLSLCEDEFYPVNFGTFHAIFYHILKNTFHYQSTNIITELEKREYLKIILNNPKYDIADSGEMIEILLGDISSFKNSGAKIPESFTEKEKKKESKKISSIVDDDIFYNVYKEYNTFMKEHRKLDFDDMVLHCYYLLSKNPEILLQWQNKYKYLLIDEYQDINGLQYSIVKLLLGKEQNLFVVGDDDQAIYKFRGSNPKIMMGFETDFPNAKKVLLETNYRSTKNIVTSGVKVIEENQVRFRKEIKAFAPAGEEVVLKGFEKQEEEYGYLINKLKEIYEKQNISYSDITCIFRTNMNASYLTEQLTEHKIPYVVKEKPKSIYSHFIAKDLLHYLAFIFQEKSRNHFFQIMNKPKRYLGRSCASQSEISFQELLSFYKEKPYMHDIIRKFQMDVARMEKMDLFAAVNYIRKAVGYDDHIKQLAIEKGIDVVDFMEIANEFQKRIKNYTQLELFQIHIQTYEKELEDAAKNAAVKDGIHLITMHASKGLEYEFVFLPDCNEGITPHKKSANKEDIEEERRMFYVGMTRAKKHLELLYVTGTKKEPVMPSRFIKKLIKKE